MPSLSDLTSQRYGARFGVGLVSGWNQVRTSVERLQSSETARHFGPMPSLEPGSPTDSGASQVLGVNALNALILPVIVVFVCAVLAVVTPATRSVGAAAASTSAVWKLSAIDATDLAEVSGCAVSRTVSQRVWLHNDAGDGALVFPVDIATGSVGAPVLLEGISVTDPEDMAIATNGDLVLADIGDNAERRKSIQLYRFTEPTVGATTAEVTTYELRYPDGPHNAESLLLADGGLTAFIITKTSSGIARVYRADLRTTTPQVLVSVATIRISGESHPQPNIITAADLAQPKGSAPVIVLRTFQRGYRLVLSGRPVANSQGPAANAVEVGFAGTPKPFPLPTMVQGEALCVGPDGSTLVTASESRGAKTFALGVGRIPR
jgi:hypothetical protein